MSTRAQSALPVAVLLVLHLALTTSFAYLLNIWQDEAYSLATTSHGPLEAIGKAIYFEGQPPAYFSLLATWRLLDGSIFFARLFSVLCVFAAAVVIARLTASLRNDVHPGWVTAVFALNPFAIWAATEIRLYGLVLLLSAGLVAVFLRVYVREEPRVWREAAFSMLALMSLYTHYYLGLLLVANAFALALLCKWRALMRYVAAMVVVGLCLSPILLVVPEQIQSHGIGGRDPVSALAVAGAVWWRIRVYLLPVEAGSSAFMFGAQYWGAMALLAVAVITMVPRWKQVLAPENRALLGITAVVVLLFAGVRSLTDPSFFEPRHTTEMFVPLVLGIAVFLSLLGRLPRLALLGFVFAFYALALGQRAQVLAKEGDSERIAAYLSANEASGQPILAFTAEEALCLRHYYRGVNPLLAVPRETSLDHYDLSAQVLSNGEEIDHILSKTPSQGEVWLVTNGRCRWMGIYFGCGILEEYVARDFVVVQDRRFALGSRVRLLRRAVNLPRPPSTSTSEGAGNAK